MSLLRSGGTAVTPVECGSLAEARATLPGALVLDVREPGAFAAGHAQEAGRISPAEFEARRMELPARERPVFLVHGVPAVARAAAEQLAARGYARLGWLGIPVERDPDGLVSRAAPARLWSPSPFLERVHSLAPEGPALDLACGSGRATVFLALAGRDAQGWDVDESALERARAFARRTNAHRASFRQVDLERGELPAAKPRLALIVVVRYLHRELFPWIERSLVPGGVLVHETFRRGQARFGPPRRARHLVEPGELLQAFPGLVVEVHEESEETAPPVMTRLVARRPR